MMEHTALSRAEVRVGGISLILRPTEPAFARDFSGAENGEFSAAAKPHASLSRPQKGVQKIHGFHYLRILFIQYVRVPSKRKRAHLYIV